VVGAGGGGGVVGEAWQRMWGVLAGAQLLMMQR